MSLTKEQSMDLREKLNQFYMAHEKKAYVIAFMALKNQEDALDVVQDVMMKFSQSYAHKDDQMWAPLFFRMVQNRITDFHRKKMHQNKFLLFFKEDSDFNALENIEDESQVNAIRQIENTEQIKELQSALKALPTRQLQAFMCRMWEGLSVAKTAQSMQCSQGSVKTHLFRALKSLKEQMNPNRKG